ncbi:hypothetical protein SapgrDRAFT_3081 [Saprospira grandis DSM 2844]|uniref:Uncharacterized protein n=1 Tax=Saprospira grandis DSM 2844 TaxID=694433 RepID=J0P4E7_9BACT|nr:hypothetical protein SapgrDRAFT_3081 [Saprospira grandis DSM 2844]
MKSRRTEKPNTSFPYKNFLSTPSPEKKPEKVEGLIKDSIQNLVCALFAA